MNTSASCATRFRCRSTSAKMQVPGWRGGPGSVSGLLFLRSFVSPSMDWTTSTSGCFCRLFHLARRKSQKRCAQNPNESLYNIRRALFESPRPWTGQTCHSSQGSDCGHNILQFFSSLSLSACLLLAPLPLSSAPVPSPHPLSLSLYISLYISLSRSPSRTPTSRATRPSGGAPWRRSPRGAPPPRPPTPSSPAASCRAPRGTTRTTSPLP